MNKKKKSRNHSFEMDKKLIDIYNNRLFNVKTIKANNYTKKWNKLRPPISQGLFSYNKTVKNVPFQKKRNSRNIKNNIFFSINAFSNNNYIKNTTNSKNNNYTNNIFFSSVNKKSSTKNSLLSSSSIDLNKYKINKDENKKIHLSDRKEKNYINKFINKSINLNINLKLEKNKSNKEKNNICIIPYYKNYFISSPKYQIESRRMILEYIKILNKREKNIRVIMKKNNISEKILNQKFAIKNINDINLNNNYYFEEIENNSDSEEKKDPYLNINNKKINIINFNKNFNNSNLLITDKNKKINILKFLFVPKVLNLIESNKESQKYIFTLVPDESTYIKGLENYKLIWRNMDNYEIENEINIKDIKDCFINEKSRNRFIIKVQMDDFNEYVFEIESPTNEVCEYFTFGINDLLEKLKRIEL